jgi:hypothetical protein
VCDCLYVDDEGCVDTYMDALTLAYTYIIIPLWHVHPRMETIPILYVCVYLIKKHARTHGQPHTKQTYMHI